MRKLNVLNALLAHLFVLRNNKLYLRNEAVDRNEAFFFALLNIVDLKLL